MLRCSVCPAGAAGPFTRPAAKGSGYYVKPHFVDEHGVIHPPGGGRQRARTRGGAAVRLVEARSRAQASEQHVQESRKHKPTTQPKTPKSLEPRTCELRFRPSTSWRRTWTAWHPRRRALKRIFDALFVYNQLVFRTAPGEPIGSILGSCCLLLRVVFVPTWSP